MRKTLTYSLIVLALFTAFGGLVAWKAVLEEQAYERTLAELTEAYDFEAQIGRLGQRWLSGLTMGAYGSYEEELERLEELRGIADAHHQQAWQLFGVFLAVSMAGGLLAWLIRRRHSVAVAAMLLTSMVALAAGLIAPAMAMTAAKDIPTLGEVTLYFESSGILATILDLLGPHGSRLIGVPLLLFSVIIPIAKTATMLLAVLSRGAVAGRALGAVHRIGKWSMADVCVVGWLLGFMATEQQELMQAEAQVGIVFFGTYAILSILAAQLLESRYRSGSAALAGRQ